MRLRRLLTILIAMAGAMPTVAAAQATPAAVLGGDVVAAGGAPLEHAMVSLLPIGRQTFTDPAGRFAFVGVPPGNYRIQVARLGYKPVERTVAVAPTGEPSRIRVELARLSLQLGEVRVIATLPCLAPGAPDARKDPDFAALFQQLHQNAVQYQLLADSFPYSYATERTRQKLRGDSVIEPLGADTVYLRSDRPGWRYKAGDVVFNNIFTGERAMHLPTLADFASKEFLANHCFTYGGVEAASSGRVIRIDFRASERIKSPDVNGFILLDAASYQIRSAELVLSRVPAWLRKIVEVRVTTIFAEIAPAAVIFSEVHGVNSYAPSKNLLDYLRDEEDQRTIGYWPAAH